MAEESSLARQSSILSIQFEGDAFNGSADLSTAGPSVEQVQQGSTVTAVHLHDNSHRTIAEWVEHIHRSRMEVVEMASKIPLAFSIAGYAPTTLPLNGRLTESEWQEHVRRINSLKEEMEIVSGEVISLRGTLAHLELAQRHTELQQLQTRGEDQRRRVRRRRVVVEVASVGIPCTSSVPVHQPAASQEETHQLIVDSEGTAAPAGHEGSSSGDSGGRKRLPWKNGMEFVEMLEARAGMTFSITRKFLATVIDRELEVQRLCDVANSFEEQLHNVRETMASSPRFSLVLDLICRHLETMAEMHSDRAKKARQSLDDQAQRASNVLRGIA